MTEEIDLGTAINNLAEALKMCARAYYIVGTVNCQLGTEKERERHNKAVDQYLERTDDASV